MIPADLARYDQFDRLRHWGLISADDARTYGYHDSPDLHPYATRDAAAQAVGSDPDTMAVYSGNTGGQVAPNATPTPLTQFHGKPVPPGGCLRQAQSEIDDGVPPGVDLTLPDRLASDAAAATLTDSRTLAANADWSACMQRKGYTYRTIWEPGRDLAAPGTSVPSAREIKTALDDVACKSAVNYLGRVSAVEAAYNERAIDQNAEDLEAVRKAVQRRIRNATRIAASAGAG